MQSNHYDGYCDGTGKPILPEVMKRSFEKSDDLRRDSRVEIVTSQGHTKLIIGGTDVSDYATYVSYEHRAGESPKLHVEFLSFNVSIDTDVFPDIIVPNEEISHLLAASAID